MDLPKQVSLVKVDAQQFGSVSIYKRSRKLQLNNFRKLKVMNIIIRLDIAKLIFNRSFMIIMVIFKKNITITQALIHYVFFQLTLKTPMTYGQSMNSAVNLLTKYCTTLKVNSITVNESMKCDKMKKYTQFLRIIIVSNSSN